jgi:peptidoglycan/xylan/chitin deacetylase (PgdA/CDA1 family)
MAANKVRHYWLYVVRAVILTVLILYLCGLLVYKVLPPTTIVSFTFDDGYASQLDAATMLYLNEMRGTFYITTGNIGQEGFLRWEDLDLIQSYGNEIAGHTITHPDLTTLDQASLIKELCDSREELINRGYDITSFAYTYGKYNETVYQAVMDCGYTSARGVVGKQESIPPTDRYHLRTMDAVQFDTSLTALKVAVKQTERAGGGWVNLVFHEICDDCNKYSITAKDFSALLKWLRLRELDGTIVLTVDEIIRESIVLNEMSQP